jgi:hypothetical protein
MLEMFIGITDYDIYMEFQHLQFLQWIDEYQIVYLECIHDVLLAA